MLNNAISQKPDGIALAACDQNSVLESLQTALDQKIPVAVSYTHLDVYKRQDEDYLNTGDKIYTFSKSRKTGWTVVGAANTSELLKNNKQAQMMYLLVAGVLLLSVIVISNIISREITRPIRQLRDSMSMVEEGQFDKANVVVTAKNEIGSLSTVSYTHLDPSR